MLSCETSRWEPPLDLNWAPVKQSVKGESFCAELQSLHSHCVVHDESWFYVPEVTRIVMFLKAGDHGRYSSPPFCLEVVYSLSLFLYFLRNTQSGSLFWHMTNVTNWWLFLNSQVAGSQTLKESGKPVKVAESDVDVSIRLITRKDLLSILVSNSTNDKFVWYNIYCVDVKEVFDNQGHQNVWSTVIVKLWWEHI